MDSHQRPAVLPDPHLLLTKAIQLLLLSLFNGGILILGITCISLLTNKTHKVIGHRKLWLAYIIVLMFLNISLLLISFIWTFSWVIYASSAKKTLRLISVAFYMSDLMEIVMLSLTDGVLVSHEIIHLYHIYRQSY